MRTIIGAASGLLLACSTVVALACPQNLQGDDGWWNGPNDPRSQSTPPAGYTFDVWETASKENNSQSPKDEPAGAGIGAEPHASPSAPPLGER